MNKFHILITARNFLIFTQILAFLLFVHFFFTGCGLYYDWEDRLDKGNAVGDKESSEKDWLLVKEVVDGDTLILSSGERVRLIGINAPEYGRYYFNEAKQMLGMLVMGKRIKLEKDITDRDQYGRLLRYVYVDGLFVNLEMVKRGFANVYTCPPDIKYTEEFLAAERYARLNELGLWERSKVCKVDITINYDAPGSDRENLNGEYVTLKNTSPGSINIEGWTVKDSATNIYEFCRYLLEPSSSVYLFSGKGKDENGKFYWGSSKPIWNNDHDTLYLRDKNGLLIEIYNY